MTTRPLCRQCYERPVMPSRLKLRRYRCARCQHHTPAAKASNARYFQSAKRKAVMQRDNAKRILVGDTYHSRAATVEQARIINAHIRGRCRAYAAESR